MPGPCAGVQPLDAKGKPTTTNTDAVRAAHSKCPSKDACNGQGCRASRSHNWRERMDQGHRDRHAARQARVAVQRIAAASN